MAVIDGVRSSVPQAQVLRNQTCGRTSIPAASGPLLVTVMTAQMSSGPALA